MTTARRPRPLPARKAQAVSRQPSQKVHYGERVGNGGQGFTASPVSDGRQLFFASELGQVFIVPVARRFSVTAVNGLGETAMATPASAEGTLYFRTRGKLISFGSMPNER